MPATNLVAVSTPRPATSAKVRWLRRWAGAQAVASLVVLNLFLWVGEHWWPVSLLLFAPRWVFLAPLVPPLPFLVWTRDRWSAALLVVGAVVTVGPIMGWNWPRPWRTALENAEGAGLVRLRVMTFNEENEHVSGPDLVAFLEREQIDLACFQEWHPHPAVEAYLAQGWQRDPSGGIASRHPIVGVLDPGVVPQSDPNLSRVLVQLPGGRVVQVALMHGETMRFGLDHLARGDTHGLETTIARRARRLRRIGQALDERRDLPTLVAGDFNTPPQSPLHRALGPRLRDAFAEAGHGFGYTWPSVLPGLRIDYVFVSPEWRVRSCRVGPALGSDHRPVVAEVELMVK